MYTREEADFQPLFECCGDENDVLFHICCVWLACTGIVFLETSGFMLFEPATCQETEEEYRADYCQEA